MRIWIVAATMAGFLSCTTGPALAQPATGNAPATENHRPFLLKRAVFKLKEGEVWGRWGRATLCDLGAVDVRWRAGNPEADTARLAAVFAEELAAAGYKSAESDNLFDRAPQTGGLQVGVIVKEAHAKICGDPDNTGALARLTSRGEATMTVEWQVYDPAVREVIARLETTARGEDNKRARDALDRVLIAAFRVNTQVLLAKPEFRALANTAAKGEDRKVPVDRSTLLIALAKATGKTSIAQASGSVVTVLVDGGHGSAFLISPDGYFLTNQHVVGEARTVRIRWTDGFETDGEVLRTDKHRDVALIKSSAHSRQPLALRPSLARAGDTVFAIGTPLDEKFEGTVTRGIVSAYRMEEGLNLLQSDVSITFGNSGGPLLDEQGAVIAISEAVYRPTGHDIPTGINLFIPIGDALDFLAIKGAP